MTKNKQFLFVEPLRDFFGAALHRIPVKLQTGGVLILKPNVVLQHLLWEAEDILHEKSDLPFTHNDLKAFIKFSALGFGIAHGDTISPRAMKKATLAFYDAAQNVCAYYTARSEQSRRDILAIVQELREIAPAVFLDDSDPAAFVPRINFDAVDAGNVRYLEQQYRRISASACDGEYHSSTALSIAGILERLDIVLEGPITHSEMLDFSAHDQSHHQF